MESDMERPLVQIIAVAAVVVPGAFILSDLLEWSRGGFSVGQLYLTYLAFLPLPFLMLGLYAVQRPAISWVGLLGALLFGASYIYFAHTALYALIDHTPDYETLWHRLGITYTVHGAVMVLGGVLFGVAVLRARVFPRWTGWVFLVGVTLNLVFALIPVPDILQTLGSTARNVGLMGMGWALLQIGGRNRRNTG